MALLRGNIYDEIEMPDVGESFQTLFDGGGLRIERIVSSEYPDPKVYDQPQDEWVMLLQGHAELQIGSQRVVLARGDWVMIPARTRHRVVATRPEPNCLWLALHLSPAKSSRTYETGRVGTDAV